MTRCPGEVNGHGEVSVNTHLVQVLHPGSQKAAGKRLHTYNAGVLVVVLCSFLTHGVVETKLAVYLHGTGYVDAGIREIISQNGTNAETYGGIRLHVDVWRSNYVFLPSHILIHDGLRAGHSMSCPPLNHLR